ncbi:DUF1631 family protein [Massilia sp. TS11]|uniref:DUF1631 family protein n=1 Tax=Massilia sp. TS11 TaxID=2908003 RepID=UPI001EDA1E20|nr:DUF1631 family protein [Massilia sp. TS11]MCG2584068.1 DUF1631 domain-containing protein [Massilia sp. TS11]
MAQPSATADAPPALFDSLAAIVAEHVKRGMSDVAQRMAAQLLDMSGGALDPDTVRVRVQAGRQLQANGFAFFHLCATGIELAVKKECEPLLPGATLRRPRSAAELSLVSYEEMDSKFQYDAIARPFSQRYGDALATMQVRLAFALQRGILQADQNPFRPEVILRAIHNAWCEFQTEAAAQALLQPLLRPEVLFDFAPLYEALNEELRKRGASARASQSIRKTDCSASEKAARAAGKSAAAKQLRALFGGDEHSLVSAEFDPPSGTWHTAGAAPLSAQRMATANAPAAAVVGPSAREWSQGSAEAYRSAITNEIVQRPRAPLLQLLNSPVIAPQGVVPPAGYLSELKQAAPSGSLSRGDEATLDLLAKVFDKVFVDPQIPAEVRELLQFLQVPVLKAALLDKDFFFQDAHPARRLVELMSRLGWEQRRSADDPVFLAMQRSVDRVGRDFQDEMAVFSEAVAELEQSVAQAEQSASAEMAAPIADALQTEKREEAKRQASDVVAVRVGGGELSPMVEDFLQDKWIDVLALAYTLEDDKPGAVKHATATMDNLIWSVKPKLTQQQRKTLIGLLPTLLASLNKWLDLIGWRDEKRLQFFSQLAEIHASIVRAPVELAPEKQLALAAEAAKQDALKVQEMEQRRQERAATREAEAAARFDGDAHAEVIAMSERGQWFAFQHEDGERKVKLAWVSPRRSLFIFSNGARQPSFTMNDKELGQALREGRARLIGKESLVAAVIEDSLGAASNDASLHASA